MVVYGEERNWDESSEEDEDDSEEESEDDDVEETDEEEDDESEEEESEEEEEEDDEDFDDEPDRNPGNIVEEYGIESIPGDEDLEKGEGENGNRGFMGDNPERTKSIAAALCCCVVLLAIIGIVLGVTLGKDDKNPAPTPQSAQTPTTPGGQPGFAPTPKPTPVPTVTPPTLPPTIPEELSLFSDADTYILIGGPDGAGDSFGNSSFLLVQNGDVDQSTAIALMTFNITDLPEPAEISGWMNTATLVLTLMETDDEPLVGNVTLETMRLPGIDGDLEEIVSNFTGALGEVATPGPSFDVVPGDNEVLVDISSLLFGQPPYTAVPVRRRMSTQETQLFVGIMNGAEDASESVRFYSAESDFPPRLEIDLVQPSASPTLTPMPSTSAPPSAGPSVSSAPSVSFSPSELPSAFPSSSPSISASPTETPFAGCFLCGEGVDIVNPLFPLENLPVLGTTTCAGVDALSAAINKQQCEQLTALVGPACCSEPYICSVCTDGGNVTNPADVVDIPGQEPRTCSGYAYLGSVGAINATVCPLLQQVTAQLCCEIEVRK